MIAKTFFLNAQHHFTQLPDTAHFTLEVSGKCVRLATTAVKHSLNNWAGGCFLHWGLKAIHLLLAMIPTC
jgi:hypothetical protein